VIVARSSTSGGFGGVQMGKVQACRPGVKLGIGFLPYFLDRGIVGGSAAANPAAALVFLLFNPDCPFSETKGR
jgi:hypothetical protein